MTIGTGVCLRRWLPLGLASVLVAGLVSGCSHEGGVIGVATTADGTVEAVFAPCGGDVPRSVSVDNYRTRALLAEIAVTPGSPASAAVAVRSAEGKGGDLPVMSPGGMYALSSPGYYFAVFDSDVFSKVDAGQVRFFAQKEGVTITAPRDSFATQACDHRS